VDDDSGEPESQRELDVLADEEHGVEAPMARKSEAAHRTLHELANGKIPRRW